MKDPVPESILRAQPGVADAAVLRMGEKEYAFVVADPAFLRDNLGWSSDSATLVDKWKRTYDFSYRGASDAAPAEFVGWNSSYTGQPIPEEAMREWVATSVVEALRFRPTKVYEIGCGSGLLLTRIAPHCERYVGSDIATSAIRGLETKLKGMLDLCGKVRLFASPADAFEGLTAEVLDFALLNSVVQYFPDHHYLGGVLSKLLQILQPGGHIFVGDVIHLGLRRLFATTVEWTKASDELTVAELKSRVEHRLALDPELSLSPAFFEGLSATNPEIQLVRSSPRRGRWQTEMTKFRCQVVLHKAEDPVANRNVEFLDWENQRWSLEEMTGLIRSCGSIGFRRIANRRLTADLRAAQELATADPSIKVAQIRSKTQTKNPGLDPEDLFEVGEELGRQVELSWASCYTDGSFDAVFLDGTKFRCTEINWPTAPISSHVRVASSPRQQKYFEKLRDILRNALGNADEQGELEWIFVHHLPRNHDGKVNESALREFLDEVNHPFAVS